MADLHEVDLTVAHDLFRLLGRAMPHTFEQNTFRLLWPSGKYMTPKLRAFIDFVSAHVQLGNPDGARHA